MKKYRNIAVALLIAVLAVIGLVGCLQSQVDEVVGIQAIGSSPRIPYFSFLQVADLETDAWYVLVDVSDSDNFPHVAVNSAILKQLHYTGVLSETTHWDVHFGVVGELGDSTTYVEWFHVAHRIRTAQFDEKWTLPEHGLNLSLKSDDTLRFVASVEFTNTAAVTTTTALTSPVTESGVVTTTAGNGDIIMFIDEIDTGGYLTHLSVGVSYDTE